MLRRIFKRNLYLDLYEIIAATLYNDETHNFGKEFLNWDHFLGGNKGGVLVEGKKRNVFA